MFVSGYKLFESGHKLFYVSKNSQENLLAYFLLLLNWEFRAIIKGENYERIRKEIVKP